MQILLYSILLAPLGVLPAVTGLGGVGYGVVSAALGVWFLYGAVRVFASQAGDESAQGEADMKHAKRLFGASIIYLFALFAVLAIEHGLGLYRATGINLLSGGMS